MGTAATEQIVNVDPTLVLSNDNIRHSLLGLDTLTADIIANNGVHTPGEAELLTPPVDGKKYRLTVGARRLASVLEANKSGAGLTMPLIIRAAGTPLDRLKRQLSENLERKNMSPIDMAIAIKKLLAEGMSKSDIRGLFPRPGGKKGAQMQPASNSWVNMTLSFLDLPKGIQDKIHSGQVGVSAAYELTKVAPEKRQDVLDRAEEDRVKAAEKEEKEEEKFLASQKKVDEVDAKVAADKMLLDVTKDELKIAEDTLKTKTDEAAAAYVAMQSATPEDRPKAEEHFKALEADIKGAKKLADTKKSAIKKTEEKLSGATKTADDLKKKLENARNAKPLTKKGPAAVSGKDVKAASAKEGGGPVALTLPESRAAITTLTKSSYGTVKKIGGILASCFDGTLTNAQMIDQLAVLVGDKPAPKVKPSK